MAELTPERIAELRRLYFEVDPHAKLVPSLLAEIDAALGGGQGG